MCGILGQIESRETIDRDVFGRMLATLSARGPDREGSRFLDADRVALGHRRLSIIDLSAAGDQPMPNEDETVWLTFNGEIYNYRELRRQLTAAGHRFRSNTDSEVIVHGYEEWGDDCVDHLRGIFAFGIWDGNRRRLLLARDHLGVKPLYFTDDPRSFVFASQPRAIVENPQFARRIDLEALRDYLGYGIVPHDRAIFEGMSKLPAGHRLVLTDDKIRVERYFALEYNPVVTDAGQALDLVREKIAEAVQVQMVSDVPVGLFLSGGIDSSITTALACRAAPDVLQTFTIGFEQESKDERPFARLVSDHFNTKHYERVLDFEAAVGSIGDLVDAYDEPFYPGSAFPTYCVSKLVQSCGIKVILSGDGGDELFAGYQRYDDFHRKMTERAPRRLGRVAKRWLRGTRPLDPRTDPMADYFGHEGILGWRDQTGILTARVTDAIDSDVPWRLRKFFRPDYPAVTAAQVVDLHTFLVDEILSKVDRASMACGVEVRVPLLDRELVELAFSIPAHLIYGGGERKALLKQAAADLLPREVLTGRKKGFSVPMKAWMKAGLQEWARPLVLDGTLVERDVFDRAGVARWIDEGPLKHTWLLLVAELWARRWLDGREAPGQDFDFRDLAYS